jgi:CheY-like chemotaxis protein
MATILIVENDPAGRVALAAVLTSASHRVLEAKDGIEALTKLRANRFDLVLCDILMPRMDGYEFLCELRGHPTLAATPVVFWTATLDEPEARSLALACGVSHLLSKAAEPEEMLKTVASALSMPPAAVTPRPELGHAYIRLLVAKLRKKTEDLGVWRAGPPARPILLVEDNPMDLDLMLQAFKESNVVNPLCVCRDGEEALQFIETHLTPDDPKLPVLVLLDLRLPKVDGIEVLRQARQRPVWKRIPFIVVTTSREDTDISSAYEYGVNSYIVKPVTFAAFAEVVKHIKAYWLLTNEPPFPGPARRPS